MKRSFGVYLAMAASVLCISIATPADAKKCRGISICQVKKPVQDAGEALRKAEAAALEAARKAAEVADRARQVTELEKVQQLEKKVRHKVEETAVKLQKRDHQTRAYIETESGKAEDQAREDYWKMLEYIYNR